MLLPALMSGYHYHGVNGLIERDTSCTQHAMVISDQRPYSLSSRFYNAMHQITSKVATQIAHPEKHPHTDILSATAPHASKPQTIEMRVG